MLDTFAAAGHYLYAKGAWLYCQLMKELEYSPYKEVFEKLLIMEAMLSDILAMNGPVLGVTSV